MMNSDLKKFDLVIIGGGIAGLWTLAEARAKGINAILLEQHELGAGQTLCSQGIIHGGSKYALQASVTKATTSIAQMPGIWLDAHNGNHAVNLQQAELLAKKQFLIPSSGIDSKILSFFGSKTMASHSKRVSINDAPDAYRQLNLTGSIFELNEPVFAIKSVIHSLSNQFSDSIYQAKVNSHQLIEKPHGVEIKLEHESILASKLLIASGEGFEKTNTTSQKMQKRPLHMVVAKSEKLVPIYAHFIGRSAKPLLTITSHPTKGGFAWYLGGGLAEEGLHFDSEDQQQKTRELLAKLLPKFDTGTLIMNSFFINRAEPKQDGLLRPDDAFVKAYGNILVGWPTKLALAPRFAEKVIGHIKCLNHENQSNTLDIQQPGIARYPWEGL